MWKMKIFVVVLSIFLLSVTIVRTIDLSEIEKDAIETFDVTEQYEAVAEAADAANAGGTTDTASGAKSSAEGATDTAGGAKSSAEGATDVTEENDVLVVTGDNFDSVIASRDIVLVEFYAPWCGHCKSLAPEFEKAAKTLKTSKYPVALAKVDATVHEKLAERFTVTGYPTLRIFTKGQSVDYEGPRDAQGIVSYMEERADPTWSPPPETVVALDGDNFTDFINAHDLSLVEFYAPWCGHCKQLAPEYEKAAQELKVLDIPLAKIDGTLNGPLSKEYNVEGYPTMKVFRRGKVSEYKGGRDKYGIVSWMQKQVGDASKEVKSLKDLKAQLLKDDVVVLAVFSSAKDEAYELYQSAANDVREDYTLLHSFTPEVRAKYKANPGSVLVLKPETFYTKFEPKWNVLDVKKDTSMSDITSFISENNVPLVGHYDAMSKDKRYKDKRPLVLFFYTVDFSFDGIKATQIWRNKIADIAKDKKFKGMTFAIADDEKMATDFKEFGFDDSGEEMNVGILDKKNKKFPMKEMDEFDDDDIEEFLGKYLKGSLKPRIKSQSVPKKQKGPVTVVVGKTFKDVVLDTKKDVLIEFYAPWCGHCKKLDPIYKDLAKKLKKEKNLVIAKMDATANDSPSEYEASGFPTIFFAPANNKDKPIKFEGGSREVEDFEKFLKEHATVSFGKSIKEEL